MIHTIVHKPYRYYGLWLGYLSITYSTVVHNLKLDTNAMTTKSKALGVQNRYLCWGMCLWAHTGSTSRSPDLENRLDHYSHPLCVSGQTCSKSPSFHGISCFDSVSTCSGSVPLTRILSCVGLDENGSLSLSAWEIIPVWLPIIPCNPLGQAWG